MAMNIKDPETERLIAELARRTGKSKTAVVREVMRKQLEQLDAEAESADERFRRLHRFMEEEIWSQLPPEQLGKPITKEEREEILGFGPDGV